MGVLLSLLSLLLVAAAGGGVRAAMVTRVDETTVSYYSPASDVISYWQTVLPHSPIPPAILEHLSIHAGWRTMRKLLFNVIHTQKRIRKPHFNGIVIQEVTRKPLFNGDIKRTEMKEAMRKPPLDGHTKQAEMKGVMRKPLLDGASKQAEMKEVMRKPLLDGPTKQAAMKEAMRKPLLDGPTKQAEMKAAMRKPLLDGASKQVEMKEAMRKPLLDGPTKQAEMKEVMRKPLLDGPSKQREIKKAKRNPLSDGATNQAEMKEAMKKPLFNGATKKAKMKEVMRKPLFDGATKQAEMKEAMRRPPFDGAGKQAQQREGHRHGLHGTGHNHGPFNLANILFSEAALTPGTKVTPFIEPSVLPMPFLRRDVADSIPMSTKNFTDIMSKFAPMSFAMAGRVWSTLHTCEHPHPLEGERQACATSVESMVELAMSVVGTCDVRAFSSSRGVPSEGLAPPPSRRSYAVAAVRAVTAPAGSPATTMTCHGVTFPYAVFYCHAVNPTRVYEVTLRRSTDEEDGGAGAGAVAVDEMRVLAVCHLDTSRFEPENPYFVARGLKPGDAAVCHFLSRDSVLWVWASAASVHGHGQAAAQ
ncbi:hypothetical protein ACP70R_031635 [Stipagrostis hirtigluma subsp. patula]